jgi:glycosyltransferase involved in cell wall biosynthesis
MYNLNNFNYLFKNLKDPWMISFEKRVNTVYQAYLSGKRTVVYIYENPDSSTFRYRGYNMCVALKESPEWGASYFFSYEINILKKYSEFINVAVIIRFRWDENLNSFIEECRRKKIKTVFDADDLIFNTDYLRLLINTHGLDLMNQEMYDHWFAYFSRINMTGHMCDAFLSTNGYLMEKMADCFKKPGFVIPNFLNPEQVETSECLRNEKKKMKFEKPFVIGYFSGSPTHKNDFEYISTELAMLIEECGDICIKVAGYMEMPDNLKKYEMKKRIKKIPYKDFRELQKEIAEVDVNIVPLLDNVFTNCKSELKFFESAIVDTVTCATPTYAYRNVIDHGKTGYLCRQGEWYPVIKDLYDNGVAPDVIENARVLSILRYGPAEQLVRIETAFNNIYNL